MRVDAMEAKEDELQEYIKASKMNLDEPDARIE